LQSSGANKRAARASFHFVIAGLDPAIHAQRRLAERITGRFRGPHVTMDHRVKPDGDDVGALCAAGAMDAARHSR